MPLPYRWLTSLMVRYNGSSVLIDCWEGTQIAIKEKGSIEHVQGKEEVYKIAEEYANTGIKYLDKIEKESSFDNYLKNFEKKALKELKKIEQENED